MATYLKRKQKIAIIYLVLNIFITEDFSIMNIFYKYVPLIFHDYK